MYEVESSLYDVDYNESIFWCCASFNEHVLMSMIPPTNFRTTLGQSRKLLMLGSSGLDSYTDTKWSRGEMWRA